MKWILKTLKRSGRKWIVQTPFTGRDRFIQRSRPHHLTKSSSFKGTTKLSDNEHVFIKRSVILLFKKQINKSQMQRIQIWREETCFTFKQHQNWEVIHKTWDSDKNFLNSSNNRINKTNKQNKNSSKYFFHAIKLNSHSSNCFKWIVEKSK